MSGIRVVALVSLVVAAVVGLVLTRVVRRSPVTRDTYDDIQHDPYLHHYAFSS